MAVNVIIRCRRFLPLPCSWVSSLWFLQLRGPLDRPSTRRVLYDEMQHALSRVIAVVAAEEVRAVGTAGIDVDLFGGTSDSVHMPGIGHERIVVLAGHKKLGGFDGFDLIIAHADAELLRAG